MPGWAKRFGGSEKGSTATVIGILAPVLFAGAALTIDGFNYYAIQSRLQRAADAAALATAKELTVTSTDPTVVAAVALRHASANLTRPGDETIEVTTSVVDQGRGVSVVIAKRIEPLLGRFYPERPVLVRAEATAIASGKTNVCAIGLSATDTGAIALRANSRLTAPGCAVYSNSKSTNGLFAYDAAVASAGLICSAGGYGKTGTPILNPQPTVDCPAIGDPLAGRADPPIGPCLENNLSITSGTRTLMPGVYCGGLRVNGPAVVTLSPGVYVFQDGPLTVAGGATLTGQYVGLFFKDTGKPLLNTALLAIAKNSTIDIGAPKTGPMAGILISESASNRSTLHFITSDDARNLLGTIYLPKGILTIDGDKPVAEKSAYTVIVARNLKLEQGPNLFLNVNYGLTDVPVPKGVGPVGARASLSR